MFRTLLGLLFGLGVGCMLIYLAQSGYEEGSISRRGGSVITMANNPIEFWFMVSSAWICGVLSVAISPFIAWQAWKASPKERKSIERSNSFIYGPSRPWLVGTLAVLVTLIVVGAFARG